MWIVSAYLIGATAPHKELSYFSAAEHAPGEIVPLPARGAVTYGLITKCEPVRDAKQQLRGAGFALQKIAGSGTAILSREFLHAAFELAAYHGASAGAVISALVPATILEKVASLPPAQENHKHEYSSVLQKTGINTLLVIGPRDERLKRYGALAKETRAQKKSALIIAPTIVEAERIAAKLPSAVLFHGELPKKKLLEAWAAIARSKKPLTVVGTPLALSLPVNNLGLVVTERALARGYDRSSRPFVDIRMACQALARACGAAFAVGSPVVPVADSEDGGHRMSKPGLDIRCSSPTIINMRRDAADKSMLPARPKFELFSEPAKEKIARALAKNESVLLVAARKGLAPHTTCDDCGTPLSCPRCGSGLVLHERREPQRISLIAASVTRWFRCPRCEHTERVHILCPVCGSWRLSMTGIGLTSVVREAEKVFPQAKLLEANDEAASTPNRAKKLAQAFEQSRGAVLAATESMLPYLSGTAALTVVVSADSMLYVPEYSAPERALAFFAELGGLSKSVLLQTRMPENAAIQALAHAEQFYARELELRKLFNYPPFATLIRLSVSGPTAKEREQADAIVKALEPLHPQRYPGRSPRRSIMREHILLRIPKEQWVDPKLLAFVRSLPPSVEIRVNPKNLISD